MTNETGLLSHGRARRFCAALLTAALLLGPSTGLAGEKGRETTREGGLGAAAALSTLIYGPVKLVYATGGLIIGSFAWAFTAGDSEVASQVFTRSLRGTYVITPDHLTGEQELIFIGRDLDQAEPTRAVAVVESPPPAVEPPEESEYDEMGW